MYFFTVEEPALVPTELPPPEVPGMADLGPPEMGEMGPPEMPPPMAAIIPAPPAVDQTTLVHNEEEAFALEPLDITSLGMLGIDFVNGSAYCRPLYIIW